MGDDEYDDDSETLRYRGKDEIDFSALSQALSALHLLGDDLFLRMQVTNLAVVDHFITGVEYEVLTKLIANDRTPMAEATFLSAQSQMWLFAAYELLRTWRQRAADMTRWHENGGLGQKLAALERDEGYKHFGKELRADQIRKIIADPSLILLIQRDLRRTQILFGQLEAMRISLAKHEVRKRGNSIALRPGHGRINRWCGALDYELENGMYSMGTLNRRDIADGLRALRDSDHVPSDEDIEAFEAFMKGPPSPRFE